MISDLAILAALIFLNGLFAAAEAAMLEVNVTKIKLKAEEGHAKAKILRKIIDTPERFFAAIQLCLSLITLFSGAYAVQAFADRAVLFLQSLGVSVSVALLKLVTILMITVLFSYFMLVFGELVPKRIAMKNTEKLALRFSLPINAVSKLASPFVKILSVSADFIVKLLRIADSDGDTDVTEDEIRMMLDVGDDIDETERERINNIFEFDNKTAGNICTHRTDIAAIDIKSGFDEIIKMMTSERYSRIPVYEENIDNIVGILHIKDLFIFLSSGSGRGENDICEVMRKPTFVPLSKKTDELFSEMQKNKIHMAIVIDEYGGTVGLITMEDLIEEIMGSILDEYDDEERPDIESIDDNMFCISGTASLNEVADFFGVNLPVSDYDTVSGFIIGQIGKIPGENEHPEIEFNGLIFKVFRVFEKRIAEIIVCKV